MTPAEVKEAMQRFASVRYKGIVYKRITAYIYRAVQEPMSNRFKAILQVELLDKNEQSVTIAEIEKVELIQ